MDKKKFDSTMRASFCSLAVAAVFLISGAGDALAQEDTPPTDKLAQTGMKFLNLSVDARASALASALTAQDVGSATAMFYNPATMAHMTGTVDVFVGNSQWIADISYNAAGVSFSPNDGRYGVFGLNIIAVDYGDYYGTIRADGVAAGYVDTGIFTPTSMAVGLAYARSLTDRFSVGGVAKYAIEDLGSAAMEVPGDLSGGGSINISDTNPRNYRGETLALDFGVVYRTGFRSLNIGMRARNFSRELRYARETLELPLTFQIGTSMNLVDLTALDPNMHSFTMSVDAERHRDYHEQIKLGGEYIFMNVMSLRGGYTYPTDEQGVNVGVGFNASVGGIRLGADYAYTQFGVFGAVNQIGINISL